MVDGLKDSIFYYYKIYKIYHYIYSKNAEDELKKDNIILQPWYIDTMEEIVNENHSSNFFDHSEKYNCFVMLRDLLLLSIDNSDITTIDRCNDMIRSLNESSDINSDYYIGFIYLLTSPNKKRTSSICDVTKIKRYLSENYKLLEFLLDESNDKEKLIKELINSTDFSRGVVELTKIIPEVLNDKDIMDKIEFIYYKKICKDDIKYDGFDYQTEKYLKKNLKVLKKANN